MTLNKAQRKRLAKEARKLAMECVDGTAPAFGPYFEGRLLGGKRVRCCAIGELAKRSRATVEEVGTNGGAFGWVGTWRPERIVSEANGMPYLWDTIKQPERRLRLVFPLLALADALEESP